jgi:hypothetical protein
MVMRLRLALVLVACAGLGAAEPVAGQLRPTSKRPHSAVVVRDSFNVAVDRLSARTQRVGDRLRVRMVFSAWSRLGNRSVTLRLGRCVSGGPGSSYCPPTSSRKITLRPDKTTHVTVASVRVPPRREDAVEITVVPSAAPPPGVKRRPIAELFLRGTAWRRTPLGDFGLAVFPRADVAVRAVRSYGAGVSPDQLRGTFRWIVRTSQRLDARTVVSPCFEGAPTCSVREHPTVLEPGRDNIFFQRPTLFRGNALVYTFALYPAGGHVPLFHTRLPWPG